MAAYVVAGLVLAPIAALGITALRGSDALPHLVSTVLPRSAAVTLGLMLGVGLITGVAGTVTAWLVTMYRFPGRGLFAWALLLPLAMPTYIIAFCYLELLDYAGPLQTALRELFGWRSRADYWFPDIRSLGGAIFVMSSVLYPYVYLTARASFLQQSVCVLEVSRTLGRTGLGSFLQIALPLARPALAAGIALALMETLNDIGAVQLYGVRSLTATIYQTWLERSDLAGAAQLACVMLLFVVGLIVAERRLWRRRRFHHTTGRYRGAPDQRLGPFAGLCATTVCLLPLLLGFLVPASGLAVSAWRRLGDSLDSGFWTQMGHSILLASSAAVIAILLALLLGTAARLSPGRGVAAAQRIAAAGYAVPGTVLAVGLLVPLAAFDNGIDAILGKLFGVSTGLILSGTLFAVILAHVIRFLAVAIGNVEAGLSRTSRNLDAAARSLGASARGTLFRVHVPLLRPALGAGALLVFVDSMKELPATLLLRPFNFETLSTQVYMLASLEQFEEAAPAAFAIVAVGLLPMVLIHRTLMTKPRSQSGAEPLAPQIA